MKKLVLMMVVIASIFTFTACQISSDTSSDKRDKLSVADMDKVLRHDFDIPFSSEGGKIVHRDGLDGSAIDIDRVIITKANNPATGDLLAFGFDGVMLEALPEGAVAALYLDMDEGLTGYEIEGIKANYLLLNGNKSYPNVPDYSLYHYDGNNWLPRILYQNYSTFENVQLGFKAIILPDTAAADEILGVSGVEGILLLQAFKNRDPNEVLSTSAKTDTFNFDTP